MTATLLKIGWLTLKRDRPALFLTFVLPIIFFSIFALIFSNMGGSEMSDIDLQVLLVDMDESEASTNLAETLGAQEALTLLHLRPADTVGAEAPWTRETAFKAVRQGEADAAIVLPEGLGAEFGKFGAEPPEVEVIYDASNPMAQFTISGLLQAASFQSSPSLLMEGGFEMLEQFGGPLTPEQQQAVDFAKPFLDQGQLPGGGGEMPGLIAVTTTAAHDDEDDGEGPSIIAYYAAGIGVMFLLFSMTGAAGGLLEEEERGTLERLLTSHVSMREILGSRWLFFTVLGAIQVVMMFVWGWAVFGLELWSVNRVATFIVMSVATAAAAAAFGLVLAAACTTRAQLGGLSTIVILVMSALGGSMVPRFVMPDFMATISKFTLNGWALDGFLNIFWYDDPDANLGQALMSIAPQVLVLSAMAVVFLLLARRLARRWEVV